MTLRSVARSVGTLLVALAMLTGCRGAGSGPAPTATLDPATVNRANAAHDLLSSIALRPDPDPPVANRATTLLIRVSNAAGHGSARLPVEIRAGPAGASQAIRADATDAGDGNYVARFTPTSSGPWTITVAAHAGDFVREVDFAVDVKASS